MFFSLTACGVTNSDRISTFEKSKQDAQIIIDGIKTKDYESIVSIFSPYVKSKYSELQSDIATLLECIDGDIVSYDIVIKSTGGHSTEEGWVEKRQEGEIYNIITSNGKTYNIYFGGDYINKENPEKVGVRYITIAFLDEIDEDGYPIEKYITYR